VSVSEVEITAGGAAEATVRLAIADGFHINANPPTFPYLIATKVEAATGEGISAGQPVYPAPVTRKFSFNDTPLAVYEGEAVEIRLPVSAGKTTRKGAHRLPAKVRVQPCNDEACFPPSTLETVIPITVK
jgi:DsbC/DsbD-like thiol-disulfide interchange protein